MTATPRSAHAQDDVEAARRAFLSAYAEERAGHLSSALEKFLELQRVRDTASVRYRIAACHEALGRLDRAHDVYRGVARVARPEDGDVVLSAKSKATELEQKLGELSLRIEGDGTEGQASVDGTALPLQGGTAAIFLAPGDHRVTFEPRGEGPVVTPIVLEGGRRTLLVLNRRGFRAPDPAAPTAAVAPMPTPPPSQPPVTDHPSTLAIASVAVGAALVAGSVISFIVRESAISSIERDCPGGQCPRAKEGDVTSARSRAEVLMPLGVVTGVAGGLALGGGVYFLVRPNVSRPGVPGPVVAGLSFSFEVPWR